ncbi:pentapeptide repeat-containing protein [Frankia canadensis]|uniref:pentapeptide repeat-containing protein n=1 Tax=Frankia canadensis TaxID=1836972 RepID=UPI000C7B21EC|nr:pentapeptide repeat-containing protein [Frankia canadensis]
MGLDDRRPVKIVAVTLVTLVTLGSTLAVCVVFGPTWIVDRHNLSGAALTQAERLGAENDVRSTLLQGLGGLLALVGVFLGAAMTLRQLRVNREGQTIDLFVKAIDQLASDVPSVRFGGIYALEHLCDLDPRYGGHVHALLTGFVRRNAPWPTNRAEADVEADRNRFHGGLADDVGAALAVLQRGSMIIDGAWSELERVDLRGAELDGFDLPRTCFAHSNLAGARLTEAKLAGATLSDTILRNTDFSRADLRGADLTRADLDGAKLLGADLSDAELYGARLSGVITDAETKWPRDFRPNPS